MRTQVSMLAIFLLAGGAMVMIAAPGALGGEGTREERCSLREGGNVGVGRGGSGMHGEAWWRGGRELILPERCLDVSLMPVW